MVNYDENFLKQLNKMQMRTHYAKITLLSFKGVPIKEIQGTVISGSVNVNSSSAIRRTVSLTMATDESSAKLEDIDNIISVNKTVKIEVGLKNTIKGYEQYGDIVWFSQGVFVLTTASSTRNTNSWNIAITAKDKMCRLDGSAGGSFPAPIVFHERLVEQADGSYTKEYPILRQIIYEAVNHYGGIDPDHIFILDLPDTVKMLVKNVSDSTIYFSEDYKSIVFTEDLSGEHPIPIISEQDAGYKMVPFTYPGELILNAGDTVVTLLDKIVEVLGNYEYFFDIEGNFIFQEIKNYINKQSPLEELVDASNEDYLPNLPASDYVRIYDNQKTAFSFTDLQAAAAITHSPKYDNIKNDFLVWGERNSSQDSSVPIRYHLAIDAKPLPNFAMKYMWGAYDDEGNVLDYLFTEDDTQPESEHSIQLVAIPCQKYEWREELYRQALYAKTKSGFGYDNNCYYEELLTEWRKLYEPEYGWNEDVYKNPDKLVFWLDIIDTATDIGRYSVGEIGRRTKVTTNKEIKTVYNKQVPDVVFFPASESSSELIEYYNSIGQTYCQINDCYINLFQASATGASCFDEIRNMLYQYLNYNTTISITCLPIYYLEPNTLIYVEDYKSGIIGNYQITQFTLPLTYNGTMNISATEVYTKI